VFLQNFNKKIFSEKTLRDKSRSIYSLKGFEINLYASQTCMESKLLCKI
jgi:hypothetical protein